MSKPLFFLPPGVTQQIFRKSSVSYTAKNIWALFDKLAKGGTLTRPESDMLWDFYLSISIIMIKERYPSERVDYQPSKGFIKGQNQIDELMDVVEGMVEYFGADPLKRVTGHYSTAPTTVDEERRFHAHFKKKAKQLWLDGLYKRIKDPLQRRVAEMNVRKSFTDPKGSTSVDGSDFNSDDESVPYDAGESYQSEQGFGLPRMEDWFSDQTLYSYFNTAVESTRTAHLTNELKKRVIRSLSERDMAQIVQTLLAGKVSEPTGRHDDPVDFYFEGTPGHIFNLEPAKGESSTRVAKGVLLSRTQITGSKAREVKRSLEKRDSNHLVAISLFAIETGADALDAEAQDVLERVDLEVIDLLLLAELIQQGFSRLSPDLQEKLNKQIEVMVKEF